MHRIWPNGKATKADLLQRLDRAEQILDGHSNPPRRLRYLCANHLADALGSVAKCLLDSADRALDAAERRPLRLKLIRISGPGPTRWQTSNE